MNSPIDFSAVNWDAVAAIALVIMVILNLAEWQGKWQWLARNLIWLGFGAFLSAGIGALLGWIENPGWRTFLVLGGMLAALLGLAVRVFAGTSEDDNRNTIRRRQT